MKEQEIRRQLKKMRMGEAVHFPTHESDVFLEVDRIFLGVEEGWVVYHLEERLVMRELEEVVQYIARHWNVSIKKVMDQQFSELDEIEDLGEY